MPVLQGTITIDGTNYVVPAISDVLEIRSDGVYNMTQAAYVWQSQSAIAGLSTTQGATAPDSGMAVGDTLQSWDAMSFYSVAAQAITNLTGTRWVFNTFSFATYEPTAYSVNGNFLGTSFDEPTFTGLKVKIGGDLQFYCDPFMSGMDSYKDIANFTNPPLTIEITGGTDVDNPTLIAWLQENALQVPADLSGTKWVFNASISVTLHRSFSIQFDNDGDVYSSMYVGINPQSESSNDYLYYGSSNGYVWSGSSWSDKSCRIIEINSGADATDTTLISWLAQNATQVTVTDLTDTEWRFNNVLDTYDNPLSDKQVLFEDGSGTEWYGLKVASNYNLQFGNSDSTWTSAFFYAEETWLQPQYQTISISGGTDASNPDLLVWLAQNATMQETPEPEPTGVKNILFGTQSIDKILFGQSEVSKIYLGDTLVWEAGSEPPTPVVVDPILANNSWETIKAVCEAGQAADYWALGDTKTDVGEDGVTRTFRICDMQGLYGKHVVFEQVELTEDTIVWNTGTNTDDDGAYNDYNISNMRNTHLPALLANYSLELQAVITNTTYKVAKNGAQTTVLDLTDKLFLPAERELFASITYSVQTEWNALTRFALYALPENDNTNFHMKFKPSTPASANYYWVRSPKAGSVDGMCVVNSSGVSNQYGSASYGSRIAPCFSF